MKQNLKDLFPLYRFAGFNLFSYLNCFSYQKIRADGSLKMFN